MEVTLASASEKQVWMTKYFREYVRNSRFQPYMTNADVNTGGIFLTRYELQEEAGKTINIPFIGRLKGSGVTGAMILDGAEEELTNFNMPISIDWRRNGVRIPKSTQFRTEINLLNAARAGLIVWETEKLRDDIIKAMCAVVTDTAGATVNFDVATAANKNTWSAANQDRLLYGHLLSNYSATFATGAGNITAASDKATASVLGLAKRLAKTADPRIRPYMVEDGDGREYYVFFCGSRNFRDLKADTTIQNFNKDARAREGSGMDKNPLFQDGDLIYDGIIIREVPEIDTYAAVAGFNAIGNTAADVRPGFLCGAGTAGIAWGQEPTPKTDVVKDYGFRPGVAIEELLGVKKINFNGVQNGCVTVLTAAAADS